MTEKNTEPADETAEPAEPAIEAEEAEEAEEQQRTLLEQMGGISGLIYSSVPVLVFVLINALFGLMPAIWASEGLAERVGALTV